jgi:hypothetical protein
VGTGCVQSFITMWVLELSMGATEVKVVAHATAVRNLSESAVHWAVRLWPIDVGLLFCEWRAGHGYVVDIFNVTR